MVEVAVVDSIWVIVSKRSAYMVVFSSIESWMWHLIHEMMYHVLLLDDVICWLCFGRWSSCCRRWNNDFENVGHVKYFLCFGWDACMLTSDH